MCYILNIETATTVCSVSISKDEEVLAFKELDNGFTHAENLHLFIQDILKETKIQPAQLNAIAVSKGPGSYTGLRIGVSTAKGLAYALNIPLISIYTLKLMAVAASAVKNEPDVFFCPMIDARRMEVYTSVYNVQLQQLMPTEAMIVDEEQVQKFNAYNKVYFFGDGMAKCKDILSVVKGADFIENVVPSARFMPPLALNKFNEKMFEDVAYFEPFYLKDFMIKEKKVKE